MKCPHCQIAFSAEARTTEAWPDHSGRFRGTKSTRLGNQIAWCHCPECKGLIVWLKTGSLVDVTDEEDGPTTGYSLRELQASEMIFPFTVSRPVPNEVPPRFADDFRQACAVLSISPKASAAISRRLLQDVLRDRFAIRRPKLSKEIEEFIMRSDVPSHLADAVDAVRNIGNFAVHPMKDKTTSMIVEVEPGEAEWLLDVMEILFDFAFVQPEKLKRQRETLNTKLQGMGKPPMKTSDS